MIETDFRTWLLEQPTITNLVGTRIYPTVVPQTAQTPAIVIPTTKERQQAQGGLTGVAETTFTANCMVEGADEYAAYITAKTIAKSVVSTVNTLGPGTLGNSTLYAIELGTEADQPFQYYEGESEGVQNITVQIRLTHSETP